MNIGFHETILYKEYNLSTKPVDILSFHNLLLESDIAKGMIFKGRRSAIIYNWTMTVDPGYKNVEKCSGGIILYLIETKDVFSSICFILKKTNW